MPTRRVFKLFFEFLNHQLIAKNEHGLHSPFLFNLYTQALNAPKRYYAFDEIDALRAKLLSNHKKIEVTDFGAGSRKMLGSERTIAGITKNSAISTRQGELLFRLVNFLQPTTGIELGTSLGLGTLYMQLGSKQMELLTFEGCPNTIQIAESHFKKFNISPKVVLGNIDETLPLVLQKSKAIDFVYIDANHNYQSTINYFNKILPLLHENSVVILDDIRWSEEMKKSWEEIIHFKEVTISLDFFSFGILFFREKQPKQNFKLKL